MTTAKHLHALPNPDLDERIKHLSATALFRELKENHEALSEFAILMEEKVYPPQSKIIQEGVESSEMFILISGTASVFKNTSEGESFKVAIINSSQHAFFGESGLLDKELRSATIFSEDECHCLVLTKKKFEDFANAKPQWAMPFYRAITSMVLGRLRKTNSDLSLVYRALVAEVRGN